jgi:hypothetical protein
VITTAAEIYAETPDKPDRHVATMLGTMMVMVGLA